MPCVAITPIRPFCVAWAAATAPGLITPITGMDNSLRIVSNANELAVLQAITIAFTSFVNRNFVICLEKACPLFVPLVEEGWLYDSVTIEIAERYLNELQGYDVDSLVLGCTHYPLLSHTIQKVMGPDVTLVNPAFETAKYTKDVLLKNGLECSTQMPNHKFYVSDGAEKFKSFANTILPCEVEEAKGIDIEQY